MQISYVYYICLPLLLLEAIVNRYNIYTYNSRIVFDVFKICDLPTYNLDPSQTLAAFLCFKANSATVQRFLYISAKQLENKTNQKWKFCLKKLLKYRLF